MRVLKDGVSTVPGEMQLQRTPFCTKSAATALLAPMPHRLRQRRTRQSEPRPQHSRPWHVPEGSPHWLGYWLARKRLFSISIFVMIRDLKVIRN